jgi:predicted chitinase
VNCGADLTVTSGVLRSIFPSITDADAEGFGPELNSAFKKYAVDTCHKIAHFFGQCEVECSGFTKFREDLTYKDGERLWKTYRSALTAGLRLLHPKWSILEIEVYAKTRLINNDSELGFVLFGDTLNTSVDYRGRGLLHLTWRENYQRYKTESNIDVVSHPFKVESDRHVAVDSSAWYWSAHSIGALAEKNDVRGVTRKISPALKHIERRRDATRLAFNVFNPGRSLCRQEWELGLKGEYGW